MIRVEIMGRLQVRVRVRVRVTGEAKVRVQILELTTCFKGWKGYGGVYG